MMGGKVQVRVRGSKEEGWRDIAPEELQARVRPPHSEGHAAGSVASIGL